MKKTSVFIGLTLYISVLVASPPVTTESWLYKLIQSSGGNTKRIDAQLSLIAKYARLNTDLSCALNGPCAYYASTVFQRFETDESYAALSGITQGYDNALELSQLTGKRVESFTFESEESLLKFINENIGSGEHAIFGINKVSKVTGVSQGHAVNIVNIDGQYIPACNDYYTGN